MPYRPPGNPVGEVFMAALTIGGIIAFFYVAFAVSDMLVPNANKPDTRNERSKLGSFLAMMMWGAIIVGLMLLCGGYVSLS